MANTLAISRTGAVGFIDWLGLLVGYVALTTLLVFFQNQSCFASLRIRDLKPDAAATAGETRRQRRRVFVGNKRLDASAAERDLEPKRFIQIETIGNSSHSGRRRSNEKASRGPNQHCYCERTKNQLYY